MYARSAIVCLFLGLTLSAEPVAEPVVAEALRALRSEPGLTGESDFTVQDFRREDSGAVHVRFQQMHHGVKVWGGQAIIHRDPAGLPAPMTDALVRDIQIQVNPNLTPQEALAIAHGHEAPAGSYSRPPSAELVIFPEAILQKAALAPDDGDAASFDEEVVNHRLAYHVRLELENGAQETRHDDYLIDAQTGSVLKTWSSLLTFRARAQEKEKEKGTPALTTGRSQYNGEVKLGSLRMECGYILSDPTRSNISTRNMAGKTGGQGFLFTNPEPLWGDGMNYDPGKGWRSENGQTAAVDAHYGLQTTWDFYKRILGRDGIDGKGRTAYNLVHYAHDYDNAFWDDDCFCMTYGDGSSFKTLTSMDVVGHEVTHGLCFATANLAYLGESGALNEANSDIFGVMINFYAKGAGAQGDRVPDQGAPWTIGEELVTAGSPHPMRNLRKPSLDGFSPDAWHPNLDAMDVHHASGPMNRAFYFLSQGASSDSKSEGYTPYLPKGMAGIGNDKALRIWWKTLVTRLTPTSRYVNARQGAILSAQELYGKGSAEVKAVQLAFKGIHVGPAKQKQGAHHRGRRNRLAEEE